jgi:hypothetical protein
MSNVLYDDVIQALKGAGASMRCIEVKKHLESLGFIVKDGKRGGHKVFTHRHIEDFTSGAFNCDHGRNPEIKRPYIKKIIKILEKYEIELIEYLE